MKFESFVCFRVCFEFGVILSGEVLQYPLPLKNALVWRLERLWITDSGIIVIKSFNNTAVWIKNSPD